MTRITILFSNTENRAVRWVGWRLFDTKEHIRFSKKETKFFFERYTTEFKNV